MYKNRILNSQLLDYKLFFLYNSFKLDILISNINNYITVSFEIVFYL